MFRIFARFAAVSWLAAAMFIVTSTSALANDPNLDKAIRVNSLMVDILCNTQVIRDMNALGEVYIPRISKASNPATERKIKAEFGDKLHQARLNQKYDMSPHQEIVQFLNFLLSQPMEDQAMVAKEFARDAHRQCPKVAADYQQTNAAAMTLISTITY